MLLSLLSTQLSDGDMGTISMRTRLLSWWYPGSDDPRAAIKALNCLRSDFCMREVMYSIQFSSVAQSCPTLCDPMDCSTPGLPVHHQLQELTQTHAHRVSDAIQSSPPLSSPSPPAFSHSQHQVFSSESVLHIRWPKY